MDRWKVSIKEWAKKHGAMEEALFSVLQERIMIAIICFKKEGNEEISNELLGSLKIM